MVIVRIYVVRKDIGLFVRIGPEVVVVEKKLVNFSTKANQTKPKLTEKNKKTPEIENSTSNSQQDSGEEKIKNR